MVLGATTTARDGGRQSLHATSSPSVDRHRDELRPAFNAEPIFSDSYWNLQCDGWYGWFFSCLDCSAIKSIGLYGIKEQIYEYYLFNRASQECFSQ